MVVAEADKGGGWAGDLNCAVKKDGVNGGDGVELSTSFRLLIRLKNQPAD